MTRILDGNEIGRMVRDGCPNVFVEEDQEFLRVDPQGLLEITRHLKKASGSEFDYLTSLTAVDCLDYFELVYHITSMKHNQMAVLKARVYDRDEPVAPSVTSVWRGADLQEREVYDLMGVRFEGHPNLKRILLWDGFQGHPLRKDFNEAPNPEIEGK